MKGEGEDEAAQLARLYDPERLERRFSLFERLTLPALLAQSDRDFRMVFLIGRSLPDVWRDRLAAAIAPLPGGRIVALAPMPHYMAIKRAYKTLYREGLTLDDAKAAIAEAAKATPEVALLSDFLASGGRGIIR